MTSFGPAAISLSPLPVPITGGCPDCDCASPAPWLLSVEEQNGQMYSVPQCPECAGAALAGINDLIEKGVPVDPLYTLTHWRTEPDLIVALARAERQRTTIGHALRLWQRRRSRTVRDMCRMLHDDDHEPLSFEVYVLLAEQIRPETDAELSTVCAAARVDPWRLRAILREDGNAHHSG